MTRRTTKTKTKRSQPEQPPSDEPFPYRDYVQARRLIEAFLQRGPFYGLLTGKTGTGKTSLKEEIHSALDPRRHQLLYVSATSQASSVGLARYLARSFRVTPKRSYLETVAELVAALQAHSAEVLLWLDEADQLGLDTLSELRGLAESSGQKRPLFGVVLSGLPELRTILDTPSLFPVKRRLDLRCVLEGLRRDELEAFLLHRFGSAGSARVSEEAHDALFERTQGTPALMSKVVAYALDVAEDGKPVHEEDARAALDTFEL